MDTLLSPKGVAEITGLKPKAIYKAIDEGELRAYRLRSRLRIRESDLEEWLTANMV